MKYIIRFSIFSQIESDLSKMDQNGSKLNKLDVQWNNHWNILSDFQLYWSFDQIESDLFKMDQTWLNWISDEKIIEIYHQIFNFIYSLIRLNQICPKWIKLVQIGFLMKQSLKYIIRFYLFLIIKVPELSINLLI